MFLRSLTVKNLRSIGELSIDFDDATGATRKQTLLLGQNGTGKSSLLKAVALITAGSNALGELLGHTNDWIRNGADFCEIQALFVTKEGEERPVGFRIDRDASLGQILGSNFESLNFLERALQYTERNYFVVGYGASRRLNGQELFWNMGAGVYRHSRSNNVATLFNAEAQLNSLTSWAIDLDYRLPNGFPLIQEALDDFLPHVQFHGIDKDKKQLTFETPDGIVPLSQLSDGYQNMTAWIGDLLYRISNTFEDYQSPLAARGLLLIDEVDLHIHPVWQRHLLDFIRNKLPNFQIIATTHSPLTAQQAEEGELFSLQRGKENRVELVPFVGSPQKLLLHQLLMTNAFGLTTDESVQVETIKQNYKELRDKPRRSAVEKRQLNDLAEQINSLPTPEYSNSLVSAQQMDFLKKLESELKQ